MQRSHWSRVVNLRRAAGTTVGDVGLNGGGGAGRGGAGRDGAGRGGDAVQDAAQQFERQLDTNLDSISSMLTDLGEIAGAQANAVEAQSEKLDRVEKGVDEASGRINKLNARGRRMLR